MTDISVLQGGLARLSSAPLCGVQSVWGQKKMVAWVGDLGPSWNSVTERTSLLPLGGAEYLSMGHRWPLSSHPDSSTPSPPIRSRKENIATHFTPEEQGCVSGPGAQVLRRSLFSPNFVVTLNKTPGPPLMYPLPHGASTPAEPFCCCICWDGLWRFEKNLDNLGTLPGAGKHLLGDIAAGERRELLSSALEQVCWGRGPGGGNEMLGYRGLLVLAG